MENIKVNIFVAFNRKLSCSQYPCKSLVNLLPGMLQQLLWCYLVTYEYPGSSMTCCQVHAGDRSVTLLMLPFAWLWSNSCHIHPQSPLLACLQKFINLDGFSLDVRHETQNNHYKMRMKLRITITNWDLENTIIHLQSYKISHRNANRHSPFRKQLRHRTNLWKKKCTIGYCYCYPYSSSFAPDSQKPLLDSISVPKVKLENVTLKEITSYAPNPVQ